MEMFEKYNLGTEQVEKVDEEIDGPLRNADPVLFQLIHFWLILENH